MHYRPSLSTEIEDPDGQFSRSDFEFIELTNISEDPIDCSNLVFTEGIIFDFSSSNFLGLRPNESAIIVRNREAFSIRYPEVNPNKMQLIEQRYRAARNNALSVVNTPNFGELKELFHANRNAQWSKYYDMSASQGRLRMRRPNFKRF